MATPRSWLPRIEEILRLLRESESTWLDRGAIEVLFELQRRAAINLLKDAGAEQTSGQLRVLRTTLLTWVENIQRTEVVQGSQIQSAREELSRGVIEAQAIRRALNEVGRPPVSFPVVEEILRASITSLPPEVVIGRDYLTIEFPPGDVETALSRLYALAMALSNDIGTFRRLTSGEGTPKERSMNDFLSGLQEDKLAGILDV